VHFLSFNVNSIRIRLHQLQAVTEKYQPDFIGLQETKVQDGDFPLSDIEALGYHSVYMGQKTHYGVALLSKHENVQPVYGFPGDDAEAQKRFIGGQFQVDGQTVHVYNGYFPQGESREHPQKFPNKQKFYADLLGFLQSNHSADDAIAVMGDFNVAPLDHDIGIGADNAKRWLRDGKCSFLPEEREWLEALMQWGLVDSYRQQYPQVDDRFSWFDYRSRGFDREPRRGLRIDHILLSKPLAEKQQDAGIDYEIRAMQKPSDHCPIWTECTK